MTADIDADTTGNRTSDTTSTTTTTATSTGPTNNNNNFISTSSSISVSNAVSKIDALLNANSNANAINGGIGANFPRNNGRKMKPLVTLPSATIEVSTSVAESGVTSDVTSDCSSSSSSSAEGTSVATTLPLKQNQQNPGNVTEPLTTSAANDTKPIGEANRNHHTDDLNDASSTARQENNYPGSRAQLVRPDNPYAVISSKPSSSVNSNKTQTQHIHHHHHHHHQHKQQLSPTQKGKHIDSSTKLTTFIHFVVGIVELAAIANSFEIQLSSAPKTILARARRNFVQNPNSCIFALHCTVFTLIAQIAEFTSSLSEWAHHHRSHPYEHRTS